MNKEGRKYSVCACVCGEYNLLLCTAPLIIIDCAFKSRVCKEATRTRTRARMRLLSVYVCAFFPFPSTLHAVDTPQQQ